MKSLIKGLKTLSDNIRKVLKPKKIRPMDLTEEQRFKWLGFKKFK